MSDRNPFDELLAEALALSDEKPSSANTQKTQIRQINPQNEIVGGNVAYDTYDQDFGTHLTGKITYLFRADCGCTVASDPGHGLPHIAGQCFQGHLVCNNHYHMCDYPGCGRMVCNRDGVEYLPDRFRCLTHARYWRMGQRLRRLLSLFIRFPDEQPQAQGGREHE